MSSQVRSFGVLVVEDEDLIRLVTIEAVEDAGLQAYDAADASEAIAHLERVSDIKVALIDVDLIGQMNGVELAHLIRDRWPDIGIIICSGLVRIGEKDLPTGTSFLAKPYKLSDAIQLIQASNGTA
ncbi:response regulator [Aureimonas psammosilenae]|uniref:response regulator n=1 Tax=Aureimonas psammosilenae TaxID=2495496 RepID=UPI001260B052|nr:response regulator [Aureimonas psammosilenae]